MEKDFTVNELARYFGVDPKTIYPPTQKIMGFTRG